MKRHTFEIRFQLDGSALINGGRQMQTVKWPTPRQKWLKNTRYDDDKLNA